MSRADDEHRVHFGFLSFGGFGFDGVRAEVGFHAHFGGTGLLHNVLRVGHELLVVVQRRNAACSGRDPEGESYRRNVR